MKKRPRILLINGAIFLPGEGGYKRTMYLFDMMLNMGYDVTLLTTDFNHYKKQVRDVEKFRREYPKYDRIEFVHMPSYKKNISVKRYISEKIFTHEVRKWVKVHIQDFDVVYMNMPGMDTILAVNDICKQFGTKIIIDVRDLRPEAFRLILKNELLYRVITEPIRRKANKAYACADELLAVSQEYLERGLKHNCKSKRPTVVYIGAALEKFDDGIEKYSKLYVKPEDEIWVTYAGTLGSSYDLTTLIKAARVLKSNSDYNIRIKILGQGPEEKNLKQFAAKIGADNVDFVGFLEYEKMAAYLSKSDLTVNSVKKTASQSIINKVADYFAAGVPMLNSCLCKEQCEMVEAYKVGVNYEPGNVDMLVSAINNLLLDEEKRLQYGVNARELAMSKFDRKTSYLEIVKRIEEIV